LNKLYFYAVNTNNNTVLITGANKGLGFETAKYLLQNDHFVYLGCRNLERGAEAVSKLKSEGLDNCELIEIDVTSEVSVDNAKAILSEKVNALDVLINNAGILGRIPTPDNPLGVSDVQRVFETNFFSTIRVTQTFLPMLKQSKLARIVNVTSSLASLTSHQDPGWKYYPYKNIAYGPSKSALNAYTVALAYHLKGLNIKVNCVTPEHTATDFNNHRGEKLPHETCKVIAQYAMIDENGPTGKFFDENGELPW